MIIEHPSLRFRTAWGGGGVCLVVQCDFCRLLAPQAGKDFGEAATEASKSGFKLVKGPKLTDPLKWSCGCR